MKWKFLFNSIETSLIIGQPSPSRVDPVCNYPSYSSPTLHLPLYQMFEMLLLHFKMCKYNNIFHTMMSSLARNKITCVNLLGGRNAPQQIYYNTARSNRIVLHIHSPSCPFDQLLGNGVDKFDLKPFHVRNIFNLQCPVDLYFQFSKCDTT